MGILFTFASTTARINLASNQIGVQVRGGGANVAIDVVGYFAAPSGNGGKFFMQGGNAFGLTAILGTTDNQPLEIKVNNQRVMRYESTIGSANVLGGSPNNSVGSGLGQTISGGGEAGNSCFDPPTGGSRPCANRTLSNHATVGGGSANLASGDSGTVGGGGGNTASDIYSTVGGGSQNIASGFWSTVPGGIANKASGNSSTVAGGFANIASGAYSLA